MAIGRTCVAKNFGEVKADVLMRIMGGEWPPGSLIPNEQDLAVEYGVARATVNRAMRELVDEGIVERKRKAGTRVRQSPVRQARIAIPLVRNEIIELGSVYRYALVRSEILVPPDWRRAQMNLKPETEVLHLVALHFADGRPYQLEDRWINLDATPTARTVDFSVVSPNEWLVTQVPFSSVEISFSATSADPEQALMLCCEPRDALFRVERQTTWQGETVTYVNLVYHRDHRMTTSY
ncbi:GntR family transcriptional regulator (plasmid) [Gemmobacter fulvus]|uniref:GntR family transcriptional regulator n=1 Tax=Gemmobacter fulvus TaxID=2840474 RepID=A0A975PBP7_9RHOB|nr:GntR family transcriptional regulator [Gemmobacter fulvus]QWK92778.1 GntR family transcriptional regulator [Gemmobacter fulvus]